MKKLKLIFACLLAIAITVFGVIVTNTDNIYYEAEEVYRVYLNGETIGLIKSSTDLNDYINNEQKEIKEKYNVNDVYAPAGLSIEKEITYNSDIEETKTVYDKLKEQENFTIDGYVVTITRTEKSSENDEDITTTKNIYLKTKDIFETAVNNTVFAFVDENEYNLYMQNNQPNISQNNPGEKISSVYVKENITIRQDHIPADEQIFEDSDSLSSYLLFGTTDAQQTYTVKDGDTLQSIADANKLNVRELLVTNPELKNENSLLYNGEVLTVGYLNPVITIVKETDKIDYQDVAFKTETKQDANYSTGYSKVTQEGVNGQKLVTQKIKYENGATTNAVEIASTETIAPVNRIVVVGTKSTSSSSSSYEYVVGSSVWQWPSKSTTLSDYFGWRSWEGYTRMHYGIDIQTNCGSTVYAANSGTVIKSEYAYALGYYIVINHNNGILTTYAHLSRLYVGVGQAVTIGQVIAASGSTGYSTGCHLHFQTGRGCWYDACAFNPLSLY